MGNLLNNALQYTSHGIVRIVIEKHSVRISDTGSGIPGELRDRIFQPFVRADTRHSPLHAGIGLSLVRQLSQASGWHIVLDQQTGQQGASLTLHFGGGLRDNPASA